MVATVAEKYRDISGGANERRVGYLVTFDTADVLDSTDAAALSAVTDYIGSGTWDGLLLDSVEVQEQLGPRHWAVSATFTAAGGNGNGGTAPPPGEARLSFRVSGQSQKITHPPGDYLSYYQPKPGGTKKQYAGIGESQGGDIEGVDILVPQFAFTIDFTVPSATFSSSYLATAAGLVGKVNSDPFQGFDAGEVLFQAMSGNVSIDGNSTISFEFGYSPNVTDDITIGEVTLTAADRGEPATKYGWEYLDIHYVPADAGQGKTQGDVFQVDVRQVYPTDNFSVLGIPTVF